MMRPGNWSRDRTVDAIGVVLGLAALGFLAARLAPNWEDAVSVAGRLSAGPIAALMLSVVVAEVGFALIWVFNTRSLGSQLSYRSGVIAYFYSGLSRFLPGAVVPYVARASLVSGSGVSSVHVSVAMAMETALSTIAALTIAFVGFGGQLVETETINQGALLVVVCVVGLMGLITYRLLPRLLRLIGKDTRTVRVPGKVFLLSMVTYALGWLILGLGLSVLVSGLANNPINPIEAAGALGVAWFAGFVAVPVPGGLGVREAVIASALAGVVGVEVGILAAFFHRVAWSIAIAAGGVLALLVRTYSTSHSRKSEAAS